MSYQSLDSFLQAHELDGEVAKTQRESCTPNKYRPCFAIDSVTIEKFIHNGYAGYLKAYFYNDRLAEIRFFPDDAEAYLNVIAGEHSVSIEQLARGLSADLIYIWTGEEYDKRTYVAWADRRLREEQSRWITKYA